MTPSCAARASPRRSPGRARAARSRRASRGSTSARRRSRRPTSAKRTTKSSGRLPSVDCSTPVSAGPNREPTASVARPITQASPASAAAADEEDGDGLRVGVVQRAGDDAQPRDPGEERCGPPAKAEQSPCARTSSRGRRARLAGLVRTLREHPPQLALVSAERVVALLDRREQLDHGLARRLP